MTRVQYFLSMANVPLTDEEYATYPDIDESQFIIVAIAKGRLLVRGIIDPIAPFEQILAYLTATLRDPQVLMVLNKDGSDYCPDGATPLFARDMAGYLAFFANGEAQNTGGGWALPNDQTQTEVAPE